MPLRAAKRKKLSESTQEATPTNGELDRHQIFTQWARERGVEINGVKPAHLPGRGLGLVTTKRIKEGERLLFIPEKAMFKPDAKMLRREGLLQISPQVQLAVSLLAENEIGEPFLKVWKATWPTDSDFKASMPMRWSEETTDLLPPSVDQPLQRQRDDFKKDVDAVDAWLLKSELTHEQFCYYWSIVNSRSFHWKPPRGKGGGFMVMCPFIDYMNHSPSGGSCNISQGHSGYAVKADRKYEPGEEVLATYGAHSNDKLLVHYGFVCNPDAANPSADDDTRLDHLLLPEFSPEARIQLQDVGFLGAYALLPAINELCFKTQVAVRAKLLTCNEWEYFMTNGEDLAEDQTAAVDQFVSSLLVTYREDAEQKLRLIDERSRDGALEKTQAALLRARWMQIYNAIQAFLEQPAAS